MDAAGTMVMVIGTVGPRTAKKNRTWRVTCGENLVVDFVGDSRHVVDTDFGNFSVFS